MALLNYINDVQILLNDFKGQFYSTATVTNCINKARRKVAEISQCLRTLPPSSSTITAIAVSSGGSGWSGTPLVTISAPDASNGGTTATASATVSGGAITAITITNPSTNSGYVATPTVTVTGTGSGFVAGAVTMTSAIKTVAGQETYAYSSFTSAAQLANSGVRAVHAVQSVSVAWGGTMKPTLDYVAWTTFQAQYRSYNVGSQNFPSVWSRYGRGVGSIIYLWPIPSVVTQMDVDTYCLPIDLINDATVEAIPEPFTEAVKYYAAYLCYLNAQRKDDAMFMLQSFKENLIECGVFDTPSFSPSAYDED